MSGFGDIALDVLSRKVVGKCFYDDDEKENKREQSLFSLVVGNGYGKSWANC